MTLPGTYSWVKCNKDFKGFYVTDYDVSVFDGLSEVLLKSPQVID
jgi:hypothetical protein